MAVYLARVGLPIEQLSKNLDVSNLFHLPDGFLYLAEHKNEIVGCGGVVKLDAETGLLKRFYISSSLRGTGLAKELYEKIEEESKLRSISQLVLDVSKQNSRAQAFYSKLGFSEFMPRGYEKLWSESTQPEIFNYL